MCGRFAQVFQIEDLEHIERIINQALGIDQSLIELFAANYSPSHNVAPTQYPTILTSPESPVDEKPEKYSQSSLQHPIGVTQAHFGLIPSWSKDRTRAASMINARSETIDSKRSFAPLYRSRRCLIPISGFFEWQPISGEKTKQPWYIQRADNQPMMLGGIHDTWLDPDHGHAEVDSFAIITASANQTMRDIHHRMPVILEPESISIWLDRTAEPRTLADLLTPSPEGILSAHRVSNRVNSPGNNDPSLIEPVEANPGSSTLWG